MGALITTYPYDPEQRKVTLVFGLGFLGLAVAFPVLYALDANALGQTVWLAPVLFLGGLATLAHWVYTGRISLRIHQGGFVHRGRFVPFAIIRGLRYKLVQVTGDSEPVDKSPRSPPGRGEPWAVHPPSSKMLRHFVVGWTPADGTPRSGMLGR